MGELEHHMEHAAHAGSDHGHGGGGLARDVGITMAAVGMLLAVCSALVGSKRTELIASMVEQTNTASQYYALSAKHRVIQAQLQQLHARMLDPKDAKESEAALEKVREEAKAVPTATPALKAVDLHARNLMDTVTPARDDLDRFAWMVMKFSDQTEAAKQWSESYDETVEAHREGAERFEWAQVAAELGIVVASIAMLFQSRKIWGISVVLGIASLVIVVTTWSELSAKLEHSEKKTVDAGRRYASLSSEAADEAADEELLKAIEESH